MKSTWIIGGDPGCDLVIDLPSVSRRHCRLTRGPDGSFSVLDLGSTNGTFVNGLRVSVETAVGPGDVVTLGLSVPMPWPAADVPLAAAPDAKVFRVGREPDNDLVLDYPEVSGHHARVLVAPGARRGVVEDLGSTNGTAVGEQGPRAARSPITPDAILYFGPVAVPASRFFDPPGISGPDGVAELVFRGTVMTVGRDPACDRVIDLPVVSGVHARFTRSGRVLTVEDLGSSNGTYVNARRVESAATVAPGDLIGLGSHVLRFVDGVESAAIGPASPPVPFSQPPAAPTPRTPSAATIPTYPPYAIQAGSALVVQSLVLAALIAALGHWSPWLSLFGLAVGSVWAGLCSAFFVTLLSPKPPSDEPTEGPRLAATARTFGLTVLVTFASSIVLMGLVPFSVREAGRWPAACGVIGLTALVGAALGLAAVELAGRLTRAVLPAAILFTALFALSVPVGPPPAAGPVSRPAAAATPIRWCFEALCLLAAGETADDPATDPVAPYFPAATDRYGTPACVTALFAMAGGLFYAVAVSATTPAGRRTRPAPGSH